MFLWSDIVNFAAKEEQVRVRQYVRNGRIVRGYTASRDVEDQVDNPKPVPQRRPHVMETELGVPLALAGIAGIAGIVALVGGGKGAGIKAASKLSDTPITEQKALLQKLKLDQLAQQTELQKVKGDQVVAIKQAQQELEKTRLDKLKTQTEQLSSQTKLKTESQERLGGLQLQKIEQQTELETIRLGKLVEQKKLAELATTNSKSPITGKIPEDLLELRSLYQSDKSTAMTKFYASIDNLQPKDAKIKFIQMSNTKELSLEEASKIIDNYEKSISGGVSVGTFKQKVIKDIEDKSKAYERDIARYSDTIEQYDNQVLQHNKKLSSLTTSINNNNKNIKKWERSISNIESKGEITDPKQQAKYNQLKTDLVTAKSKIKEAEMRIEQIQSSIKPDNTIKFAREQREKLIKDLQTLPYEKYAENFAALGSGRTQMELKQYLFLDQYLNKNPEKLKEFKDYILAGSLLKNYKGEQVGFSMLTGEDAVRNAFEYGYTASDIANFNRRYGTSINKKAGFEGVKNIYKKQY